MTKGIIYFVYCADLSDDRFVNKVIKRHYNYALVSIDSVRRHMPGIPITLFTNLHVGNGYFDNIIYDEGCEFNKWNYKYHCFLRSPYDHTLAIDADTYVCMDFSEVFDLLEWFDFAATMSIWYMKKAEPPVPICFPEYAGGFVLWRSNEKTINLFKTLLYRLSRKKGNDEPDLRKALYESDVRIATLPWEYNYVHEQAGYLFSDIRVAHGRSKTLGEDAELINSVPGRKIFSGEKLYHLENIKDKKAEVVRVIPYGYNRGEDGTY